MVLSHVQIRGSVPCMAICLTPTKSVFVVFWEQTGLQLTSHRINITRGLAATRPSFERHFEHELTIYGGSVAILSLLSQDADGEKLLSDTYHRQVLDLGLSSEQLRWISLDFNRILNAYGGSLHGVKEWISGKTMSDIITNFGLTVMDAQGLLTEKQSGVFRVNCIDCLDRSNVVQGLIASFVLDTLISRKLPESARQFLSIANQRLGIRWSENGDALAQIYAGSGAMKNSLLQSSGTTWKSLFVDAQKAVQRAVASNFTDQSKHIAIHGTLPRI